MPSDNIVNHIRRSLAPDENPADFEYLFDVLASTRLTYQKISITQNEQLVGSILCVVLILKPHSYLDAMQEFRLLFRGVSEGREKKKKAIFYNCILPAALALKDQGDIEFQPSLYFDPLPILQSQGRDLGTLSKWY